MPAPLTTGMNEQDRNGTRPVRTGLPARGEMSPAM
ncbi:hypothetical protein J2W49_001155 [Hydrogenophaga palleronii]|uniref:Uncharacterized protein n=1 Tax=Hydrogenophaga palleronii TaxID=65655 RepID=A0ABU1WJJ3_9BURK|nr:hypothetical protein [Hydrogenophaga palleronii]